MNDRLRQLMITAQRAGLPVWVSDDREAIVVQRHYPTPSPNKTKPVQYRVENLRQLYNLIGQ